MYIVQVLTDQRHPQGEQPAVDVEIFPAPQYDVYETAHDQWDQYQLQQVGLDMVLYEETRRLATKHEIIIIIVLSAKKLFNTCLLKPCASSSTKVL